MAIATLAAYRAKLSAPHQRVLDTKTTLTSVAGRWMSMWRTIPDGGAAGAAGAALGRSTVGALGQQDSANVQRLAQIACSLGNNAYVLVCDRLVHQGGLVGNVATVQTTNLPTPALPRFTSGEGVIAAIEIYTAIGTAAQTFTASYTNQAGTPGRTSESNTIGATGWNNADRLIPVLLQSGDTGVRSVESIQLSATTGTAGNMGVTLLKPLFGMSVPNLGAQQFLFDGLFTVGGNLPVIPNDACLFYVVIPFTTSTGIWQSAIRIIEDV